MQDYQEFVDKFKPKKTTDDCYTPPLVYEAVRDWAVRGASNPLRRWCMGVGYELNILKKIFANV